MEKRYRAIRIIGSVYKVFGVIVGIITILMALAICGTSVIGGTAIDQFSREYGSSGGIGGFFGGVFGGLVGGLLTIISGGAMALTLYATGEGLYVLLAIEENTRATAALVEKQL